MFTLNLTISNKTKTRLNIEKILVVLERNSFEVDLKRLDDLDERSRE